jgi:hypothetical protein
MPRMSTVMRSRDEACTSPCSRHAKRVRHRHHGAYPALNYAFSIGHQSSQSADDFWLWIVESEAEYRSRKTESRRKLRQSRLQRDEQPMVLAARRRRLALNRRAGICKAFQPDAHPHPSRRINDEIHRAPSAFIALDWSPRHHGAVMPLQPRRQPGRTDRKAAAYASEILRLRAGGYTYEAIREALADIGIQVSTSALRREMRRHQAEKATSSTRSASPSKVSSPLPPSKRLASLTGTSGREIAEDFFNTHASNPLLRA